VGGSARDIILGKPFSDYDRCKAIEQLGARSLSR